MRFPLVILLLLSLVAPAQERPRRLRERPAAEKPTRAQLDRQIAAQFAPLVYQGLGQQPRSDYITNFDFDGDWAGDNNWRNLDNRQFPLRAYAYFSVKETTTHYFIHYAFFHPRDYKGGLATSILLEEALRRTIPRIGKDPTGRADDVALSHENDLEGCLVVAEKRGQNFTEAIVSYVETMAHNRYLKYQPPGVTSSISDPVEMNGQRPLLFMEPRGHGLTRYTGDQTQLKNCVNGVLIYNYTGRAEDPETAADNDKRVGYDLLPIYDTLWSRADQGVNETYGETLDYQTRTLLKFLPDKAAASVERKLGQLGAAFLGSAGFKNKARPPWAWFDDSERDRPRGEWFFDPAAVIARHFSLGPEFSTAYVYHPYFKIGL